jgi:hypothetical protein
MAWEVDDGLWPLALGTLYDRPPSHTTKGERPSTPMTQRTADSGLRRLRRLRRLLVVGLLQLGTISRKTSDSTDKSNGQNPFDIAITNALELLRGQNFEN